MNKPDDRLLDEKAKRVVGVVNLLEDKAERQGWAVVLHRAFFQNVAMEIEEYYAPFGEWRGLVMNLDMSKENILKRAQ